MTTHGERFGAGVTILFVLAIVVVLSYVAYGLLSALYAAHSGLIHALLIWAVSFVLGSYIVGTVYLRLETWFLDDD